MWSLPCSQGVSVTKISLVRKQTCDYLHTQIPCEHIMLCPSHASMQDAATAKWPYAWVQLNRFHGKVVSRQPWLDPARSPKWQMFHGIRGWLFALCQIYQALAAGMPRPHCLVGCHWPYVYATVRLHSCGKSTSQRWLASHGIISKACRTHQDCSMLDFASRQSPALCNHASAA